MKRSLAEVRFKELSGKSFKIIRVVEMRCEVCEKPISTKEKLLREIQIATKEDYQNLLDRAAVHDRAEVDTEEGRIFFYDHDFPGDIHDECIARL